MYEQNRIEYYLFTIYSEYVQFIDHCDLDLIFVCSVL